jgi:hypothetical protein
MAQVPADLLLQLEAIAVANGLLEQIALGEQLQAGVAAAGTSPLLLTDTALAGFCWLSAYKSSAVGGFGSFTSTACDYGGNAAAILLLVASVATAGTFSPAAIAILTGIVSGCAFVAAPVAISEVVTEFAPDLKQARLALTATPAVLVPPQLTSELRVSLNVPINPELVNGAESIRDKILRKAVDKLLSKTPVIGALKRAIRILPEDIRKEIEDRILGVASSAVGSALDQTQLGARFDQISAYLVAIGSAYGVTLDPNGVLDGPTPAVGVLQLAPPGTEDPSIYTGDAAQPATVTFTAAKVICGMPLSASAQVSYGVRPVVITMGDNGALLDDIFLVEVDGQTVLTSQVPVTQTSTTVELTLGDHVAIMRGLAAPDGIGTYYILFNGATVLPGSSATSGSNLVPGTFKTFNIRVQ